ncbi:MAG: gamma-glutamyltransferase [Chloroflexota bacterium]
MTQSERKTLGIVAAPHHLAAQVGAEILRDGGNAFDAAVSVALAIGVVQPYHSGIGGGCNITFRTTNGETSHINARGPAPHRLERKLLLHQDGTPNDRLATMGGMASTIPSFVAGLSMLHEGRGQLPWRDLLMAPRRIALEGFPADFMLANVYHSYNSAEKLTRYAGQSPLGQPIVEGQQILQPQMAATLDAIAQNPRTVYEGEIGERLVAAIRQSGGVLSMDDLSNYRPEVTQLHNVSYGDWHILAPGLPTIGSLQTLLSLRILDQHDLSQISPGSIAHFHLIAEAVRATYAARAQVESNEDAAKILDVIYAQKLAADINLNGVTPSIFHQLDGRKQNVGEETCTSHFCVADDQGNIVSQTQTVRSYFGSGVIDSETGIVLNDSVGDFSLRPGEVTTQGIRYQGNYNLVGPGAEPASSQCPLIAIHPESGDVIAAGGAGGPRIVSATLQALVNQISFGMDPRFAAIFPRVHSHGPVTDVEPNSGAAGRLSTLGHQVRALPALGIMQTIRRRGDLWEGGADPRGPGSAVVVQQEGSQITLRGYGQSTIL